MQQENRFYSIRIWGWVLVGIWAFSVDAQAKPNYGPYGELLLSAGSLADITPDGSRVLILSQSQLEYWDTSTGERILSLDTGGGLIDAIALSADGNWGLSTRENWVTLWNLSTGEKQFIVDHGDWVYGVEFLPDGKSFMSLPHSIELYDLKVWDLSTGELRLSISSKDTDISSDSTGNVVRSVERVAPKTDTTQVHLMVSPCVWIHYAVVSPDGKWLFVNTNTHLEKWDLSTGQLVEGFEKNRRIRYNAIYRHPIDQRFLLLGMDSQLKVYDFSSQSELQSIDYASMGNLVNTAVSPDGNLLALSLWPDETHIQESGYIALYDLNTGELLKTFGYQGNVAVSIKFTQDGEHLLTGGGSTSPVRIWNLTQVTSSVEDWTAYE